MKCRSIACAAFVVILLPRPAEAADRLLDARQFAAALDDVAAAIERSDASRLPELAGQLPSGWSVALGSDRIEVPAGWLHEGLRNAAADPSTWPAVRSRVLQRLTAMRLEARGAGAPTASADAARTQLADVLSRREFATRRTSTWADDLRGRIAGWILELWRRMGGERLGREGTAIVLAWMAGLGALAVLAYWLVGAIVATRPRTGVRFEPGGARRASARAWALRAAAAADPRETARCAYQAAIVSLDEEGAWRLDDARTPREYLRLLPAAHRRRPIVAEVTGRFEQIWYGGRAGTAADVERLLAGLRELGCLPRA